MLLADLFVGEKLEIVIPVINFLAQTVTHLTVLFCQPNRKSL